MVTMGNGEIHLSLTEQECSDIVLALMGQSNALLERNLSFTANKLWELAKRVEPISGLAD